MSENLTEDQIRDKVIDIRKTQGLTIDKLSEMFPSVSRSKIGRWCKGITRDPENTHSFRVSGIEDDEINDNEIGENPLENTRIEQKIENPIPNLLSQPAYGPHRGQGGPEFVRSSPHGESPSLDSGPSPVAPGMLGVPPELWQALEKIDKKNIAGWKQNVLEWNRLQQQRVGRNDGHGVPTPSRYYGEGELDHEMAQMVKQRRFERMMKDDRESPELKRRLDRIERKLEGDKEWSRAFEILKFVRETSPTPKSISEIIAEVTTVQNAIREMNPVNSNMKVDDVMKLEDRRHARNMEKLKAKNESKKWETIYKMAKPIIDKTVPLIDDTVGLGRRKLRGTANPNPSNEVVAGVVCPFCLKEGKQVVIPVVGTPPQITCPTCGRTLQRQDVPQDELTPENLQKKARQERAKHPHQELLRKEAHKGGDETK